MSDTRTREETRVVRPLDLLTDNQLVVPKPLVREAFSDLCSSDVAWEAENPLPARAVSFSACLGPIPPVPRQFSGRPVLDPQTRHPGAVPFSRDARRNGAAQLESVSRGI